MRSRHETGDTCSQQGSDDAGPGKYQTKTQVKVLFFIMTVNSYKTYGQCSRQRTGYGYLWLDTEQDGQHGNENKPASPTSEGTQKSHDESYEREPQVCIVKGRK